MTIGLMRFDDGIGRASFMRPLTPNAQQSWQRCGLVSAEVAGGQFDERGAQYGRALVMSRRAKAAVSSSLRQAT
ncbi:MAG: hypothetical protein IPF39_10790 [Comamonadaceae bacterium]|uniref:hypothetical protein n=1 Tax=Candidatus Skiveiella danica TaxID=3386177 RepID=UPI00390953A7|nr:hypothetical protein [Comamonadaceae bacterium]